MGGCGGLEGEGGGWWNRGRLWEDGGLESDCGRMVD